MLRYFGAAALLVASPIAHAQISSPSPVPRGYVLAPEGTINSAYVSDVVIDTKGEPSPFTAFLIRPVPGVKSEWFYVHNDDVSKALERGGIVGLLMGAAQANRWGGEDSPRRYVNIRYVTVNNRKEIVSASLSMRLE